MDTRRKIERTQSDSRKAGLFFLIALLAIAFFPSMASELKAWNALQSLAESVLRAIPALAAMDMEERTECAAPGARLFAQHPAELPTIDTPRLAERASQRVRSRSDASPSLRQIQRIPNPRGPPRQC